MDREPSLIESLRAAGYVEAHIQTAAQQSAALDPDHFTILKVGERRQKGDTYLHPGFGKWMPIDFECGEILKALSYYPHARCKFGSTCPKCPKF